MVAYEPPLFHRTFDTTSNGASVHGFIDRHGDFLKHYLARDDVDHMLLQPVYI